MCWTDNRIEAEGALAIFEALKSNTTLAELKLESCEFGNEPVAPIIEILGTNTTLYSLRLLSEHHTNTCRAQVSAFLSWWKQTNRKQNR